MLRTTRCIKITTLLTLAVLLAAPLYAAPAADGVADVLLGTTQVDWVPTNTTHSLRLVISGPDGVVEHDFQAGETPTFDLTAVTGNIDGSYSWQLTATPQLSGESRRLMAEARAAGTTFTPNDLPPREQLVQSGHFRVLDGAIVQPSATPEPKLGISTGGESTGVVTDGASVMTAEQYFTTDVEIAGSLCVGFDCVNGENFGFDTVRLKENNLRIKFQDTSSSGSFPSTDWQITINDTANGGASYYRIEDVTNGKRPFTIEANTPNNTLYVDSTGRVGIGTDLPVVEAHVQDGDTPTLRLQQDGSSGFTQQIWDIAGNETNFFVRDVTNGSKLSFRIKPGAPENSIFVAASGFVGMGTASPAEPLHVKQNDSSNITNMALLENPGGARIAFKGVSDATWRFGNNSSDDFVVSLDNTGVNEAVFRANGNLAITGEFVSNGTTLAVPDYVFAPEYELMPLDDLRSFVATNRHLPNIPNEGEVRAKGLNLTEMQLRLLEKVEELTLYTLSQDQTINELSAVNAELLQRLEKLEGALETR